MNNGYKESFKYLKRAQQTIPLASQTFSKSHLQYPPGHMPLFVDRGQGARLWDLDGNCFVDLVMGLLPCVLGYCDSDVDRAVSEQLQKGVVFSLATRLECELAERLVEIIPCAEMVRFGKNGSDATSGAVRLARAYTGRKHIAICGYHGWHDWYIGTTVRNLGVPEEVSQLSHRFAYNDIDALEKLLSAHPREFAAVIMEPMSHDEPLPGYLQKVKDTTQRHGTLLIFDEVITGFRFSLGGAQELFGVTPDLACFGKSLGNGMPISVLLGRREIMKLLEDVFFSFTFGGEALSLAAALAVVEKMQKEPVIETLWKTGEQLSRMASQALARHSLADIFHFSGKPCWRCLAVDAAEGYTGHQIKTRFVTEMARQGVLMNSSHNVCYALNAQDLSLLEEAYDISLASVRDGLEKQDLHRHLPENLWEPVFKVRG